MERALALAIQSAENAFGQLDLAKDDATKSYWRSKAQAHVSEAERLKALMRPSSTSDKKDERARFELNVPRITRALPKSEQILLLKASYVNGNKYPPWSGSPEASEFELNQGEDLFLDDTVFSISEFQENVFDGWKRPDLALRSPTMVHLNPLDLVQDASTDCSVVASLCAGVARHKRGHQKLTSSVIYPWDKQTGYPSMSSNGKYIIRLNFNGCFRRVVIDDRLPTSSTERFIHVIDRQNPNLLWPALIEKAYLKVRGGYDFPGSNSATDLWVLTGWVPEQVFLQAEDLDLEELWTRMWTDWSKGGVLITMGTGKISKTVEREVGLAGEHDYAVLELQEIQGQRLMLVKNPWCEGTNWHRVPQRSASTPDITSDTCVISQARSALEGLETAAESPRDLLNADAQLSPGTFWMDLDNAAQYFESIYLNWNPGRFQYRQDLHFAWDLSHSVPGSGNASHASLRNQPQFAVSVAKGGPVWLLLCRHLDKTNEMLATSSAIDLNGFISLSAYAADGKRVKLSGKVVQKSNIVDSPQILLKLDCEHGQRYTIVTAEQELARKAHTFTISAFSSAEIQLGYADPSHHHSKSLSASWTRDTAGGNANSTTYGTNPQFSIALTQPTRISILLEAGQDLLNVHVKVVHGNGKRIRSVRNRDVVFDSGDYRRRCCVAEYKGVLEPGIYTAICSTFEPQQLGLFEMIVESDSQLGISVIPREGAGRLTLRHTATFPHGCTKIAAKLTPVRMMSLYAIASAQQDGQGTSSQLRLSIEQGQASQRRIIVASEDDEFSTATYGPARTEDLDMSPDMLRHGQLWLVVTRVCVPERALRQEVDVDVLIDQPDAVTVGHWTSIEE